MANEIKLRVTTGLTLYAIILRADGQVWNGAAFESLAAANWGTYDIALSEQSTTGIYFGDFPAVSAGIHNILIFKQIGGSPATTDPLFGQGTVDWDGSRDKGVNHLNDLSAAQVNTEVDTALAGYDGPTHAELVSEINSVQADIAALDGASAEDIWTYGTRTLTAAGQVTFVGPVTPATLRVSLIRGDTYSDDDSRSLEWTDTASAWPDLTGATVSLYVYSSGTTPLHTFSVTVVTPTGTGKVRLELTALETAELSRGSYRYEVVATLTSDHIITLVPQSAWHVAD